MSTNEWVYYAYKGFGFNNLLMHSIERQIGDSTEENVLAVCEIQFDWKDLKFWWTTFDQVWSDLCPCPIIPFDLEERRRVFAPTYESLKDYIKAWESSRLTGWRKSWVEEVSPKGRGS